MFKQRFKYFLMVLTIVLASCAKRGTINGGLKDTLGPVLKSSFPRNYSTDFKGKTIKLTFDEYVKLKNVNKQLIVSPPMDKAPEITPTNPSKTINIAIKDSLLPNTTYSFNFGQSIEDNNEGNPYKQFKYIFSTGPYIDSLSISGTIKDAYTKKTDNFVSVMLYDIDEKYNDSVIFKKSPRYITNTLDSAVTFKLENLKAGKYMLVALKDQNSNYRFNPKTDKIGFRKQLITVPNDSLFEIALFKEEPKFQAFKPSQASGNSVYVGYEGNTSDAKFTLQKANEMLPVIVTKVQKKDSLQLWFKPIAIEKNKTDSLALAVTKGNYSERFIFKIKNQKKDTLNITAKQDVDLPLGEKFALRSNVPLTKFDVSKMRLTKKDSASVNFTTAYDERNLELTFDFPREPLEKYRLELLPGALTDFMDQVNDSLVFKFETRNTADFGNLRLTLENVKRFPIIIELTDKNENVIYSAYSESNPVIDFNLIKPDSYTLRIVHDDNANKVWDAGNFLEKRQSEEVIYFPKEIDVRANWDVVQPFSLSP